MTTRDTLRKGWCPGALRPMETGDGLLLRIRPRLGRLTIAELRIVSDVSSRCSSGHIDLTNRANLQLRGLTAQTYETAIEELGTAGLIDNNAAVESVRNIIVDPLAGLDPQNFDMRILASELERRLEADPELHKLPSKFGFEFSGQSAFNVHGTDIQISPSRDDQFAIKLDGDTIASARVSQASAIPAIVKIARLFIDLAEKNPALRRMRDAVADLGASELFQRTGLSVSQLPDQISSKWSAVGRFGTGSHTHAIGIGIPFGRITAHQLRELCNVAENSEIAEARISKHRSFVFPIRTAPGSELFKYAAGASLIVDDSDPRLNVDVCPGAPACRNATTETRKDAERLVHELQSQSMTGLSLHISGCEKGCARASKADFTFIANNGSYDIVANGTSSGVPFASSVARDRIGSVIRSRLTGASL